MFLRHCNAICRPGIVKVDRKDRRIGIDLLVFAFCRMPNFAAAAKRFRKVEELKVDLGGCSPVFLPLENELQGLQHESSMNERGGKRDFIL